MKGAICASLFAAASQFALAAEENLPTATPSSPASITAPVAPATQEGATGQTARVTIKVMAFQPPKDGAVQAVVKVQTNGAEREIGRFGIFPNAEFRATEPSKAQRFGLPMPKELAAGSAIKLKVYLVPFKGEGRGASMEIGGADVQN